MARGLARRRVVGEESRKASRPVKESKAHKASSKISHVKPVSKTKAPRKQEKLSAPPARDPVQKESTMMEAETSKPALKAGIATAYGASRLLQQTKTTSAALALLEKGIQLLFKKDFKKARAEFMTLLETYPEEYDILARARSYIQICEREEAAQKKAQVSTDQLYTLGVMEHNKANYDAAISYFRKSLEKHPDADYIYYSVAASLAMRGDLAESIENLRKAVELNEESRVYAKNDSDFAPLQAKQEFADLVGLTPASAAESH